MNEEQVRKHLRDIPFAPTETDRIRELVAERTRRSCEALRLYQPLPMQDAFHACMAKERLIYGSNRGAKTTAAIAEVARAATGQDPYGKYPLRDARIVCVGKDLKHIGRVMWRKLYHAGAIKMIRDAETGLWRSYRPWDIGDVTRKREVKLAPPFLPRRFIESISWENKKENVPSLVKLRNGSEIAFFSSLGKPEQGTDLDLVYFDEEIVESTWYDEMLVRIVERSGRIIWSATPQAATEQLYAVHQRAQDAKEAGDKSIQEFFLHIDGNPYITAQDRDDLKKQFADKEEVYRVRIEGGWAIEGYRVFPEFSKKVHCIDPFPIDHTWARYAAVDPGVTVCAVLFLAVPPPELGDFRYIYDELYIRGCNAHIFAENMAIKCRDQQFELFLIDRRSAVTPEQGSGRTVQEQYSLALAEKKVTARATGSNFLWATTDMDGSIEAVKGWMRVRGDGKPKLLVFRSCNNFITEAEEWHYVRTRDGFTQRPVKRNDHLCDDIRFLAAHGCEYVKPPKGSWRATGALQALQAKRRRKRRAEGGPEAFVQLGPPL